MHSDVKTTTRSAPSRMTVFAFIWASQVLVHQAFFPVWVEQESFFGWMVTAFALATLLNARSLIWFSGMLFCNLIYNFGRWPSVANHILMEFLVELMILLAILFTIYRERASIKAVAQRVRDDIFDRFAPVLIAMLIAVYYIIFVSKLNWDFANLDISCLSGMYQDVVTRFEPLLIPTGDYALQTAYWLFLIVEIILPVMLMFRKTRYAGMLIALPFHLVLGLIGHWTFSALVFAVYSVFCIVPLVDLLADVRSRLPAALIEKSARAIVPIQYFPIHK